MQDLQGKTAVITGGASGIGLGMARAFAARGMNLVIGDLDAAAMQAAEQEFTGQGVDIITQACDVSSLEAVQAQLDRIEAKVEQP